MKRRVDIPLDALVDEVAALREIPWERLRATEVDGSAAPDWISRNLRILSQVASMNDHRSSWGPFTDLERIGGGYSGEVFRGVDPESGQHVALKLFHPTQRNPARVDPDRLDEARRLQRLESPAVARVYGAGAHDDRVGLWMEWVEGRTCEQAVALRGPFPSHEAVRILTEVCDAIAQLHRAGLVFREIRPSNVMLTPEGRVRFLDAGGSGTLGALHLEELASAHSYTAPEVLLGAAPTPRSDVFALGCLFHFLLTARLPYPADTVDALVARYRDGSAVDWGSGIPAGVRGVLERALSTEPGNRPSGPEGLATQLAEAASTESSDARGSRRAPTWMRWIRRQPRD